MRKLLFVLVAAVFLLPVSAYCAKDVAVLSSYEGDVMIRLNDEDDWGEAVKDMLMQEADSIKTGATGKAKIVLSDGSVLTIGPLSMFYIKNVSEDRETGDRSANFELEEGAVRAKVAKLQGGSTFTIETPTAVAGVRGTDFVVEMKPDTQESIVTVLEGQVEVGSRIGDLQEKVILMREQTSSVKSGRKPGAPEAADGEKMREFREKLSKRGGEGEMNDDQAAAVVAVHGSNLPERKKREAADGIKQGEMDPGQVKEVIDMGERAGISGRDLGNAVDMVGENKIPEGELKALGDRFKEDPNIDFKAEIENLGEKYGVAPPPQSGPGGPGGPEGNMIDPSNMRPPVDDRLNDMKEGPMTQGTRPPEDGARDPDINENLIFQKALDIGMPVDKVEALKTAVREGRMMLREVELIVSAIKNGVEPKFLNEVYNAMIEFKLEPRVREMVTSALSLGLPRDKLKMYLDGYRDKKITVDQIREQLDYYIQTHVDGAPAPSGPAPTDPIDATAGGTGTTQPPPDGTQPPPDGTTTGGTQPPPNNTGGTGTLPRRSSIGRR